MLIIRLVTHRRKTCLPCFPLLLPLLMSTTAVAEYCYYTPPEKGRERGGRKTKKCRLWWGGRLTNLASSVPAMGGGGKTRRRRNKSFSWKNAAMRHEGSGVMERNSCPPLWYVATLPQYVKIGNGIPFMRVSLSEAQILFISFRCRVRHRKGREEILLSLLFPPPLSSCLGKRR